MKYYYNKKTYGLEKYIYEQNPNQPIAYGGDKNYIDIIYADLKTIGLIQLYCDVYKLSFNTMLNYLYTNINNKIYVKDDSYMQLYYELKPGNLSCKINKRFYKIFDYLLDDSIPDEIIILGFLNAQSLFLSFPKTAHFKKNADSFVMFTTSISKINDDNICIHKLGTLHTNYTKKSTYDTAVTVKITKSKYDLGYIMELGRLIKIDEIERKVVSSYINKEDGLEVLVCEETEL